MHGGSRVVAGQQAVVASTRRVISGGNRLSGSRRTESSLQAQGSIGAATGVAFVVGHGDTAGLLSQPRHRHGKLLGTGAAMRIGMAQGSDSTSVGSAQRLVWRSGAS